MFATALLLAPIASAAPNPVFSYEAKVTRTSGVSLGSGTYTVVFKIYDAATGGTTLWQETHSVSIKNGLLATTLGSSTTLDLDFNSGEFYLGVTIGSDTELSPRKRLGAAPFAANAKKLDGKTVGTGANQILAVDGSQNLSLPKKLTVTDGFEVSGGSITLPAGAIQGAALADGAISTAKLADSAVTTAKVADSAVTTAKISDGTIATGDLADSAVTTAKLSDGTIATADIADSAVTAAKIADGTIAAGDLASDSVTTAKILDGTIAAADLASSAVSTAKIADSAVTYAKLSVADQFDFDDFADNMVLDTATLIDLGNSNLAINMGGTGQFALRDTDVDVLTYDPAANIFEFGATVRSAGGTGWSINTAGSISIAGGQVIDTLSGGGELRIGRTNATSIVLGSGSNDTIVRSTGGGKGLKVGDGATNALSYYDNTTSSVDFADTVTATCSQSGDITFTNAALEDSIQVASPGALVANTFLTGHVTAANTVRIQFCNLSGVNVNPAVTTYRIRLMR